MRALRAGAALFSAVVIASLLAGCSGGAATSSELLDASYSPRMPLSAAVSDFLLAEQSGAYKTSYSLLTPESRKKYKDVADWEKQRKALPAVKAFELQSGDDSEQTVTVEHPSGKATEVWKGKKYNEGWLVEAEPEVQK